MSKYIKYELWHDIQPGWYDFGGYKGYKFKNGLMIDRTHKMPYPGRFYYLDTNGIMMYTRSQFKDQLTLRNSKVWKALYSIE